MLNLLNNSNNYSLLDNSVLNYGLLLVSLGILGYSIYNFSIYLTKNNIDTGIPSLPNAQNINQRIVETIEYQNLGSQNVDNIVPKLSNDILESLVTKDRTNLVDSSVQTDPNMLYEYLKELLYNNATPTTSLGEISPTDFIREYKNDPALASYFEKTANWADSISRQSSSTSANSEVMFLRKVNEDIQNIRQLIENNLSSVNVESTPIYPIEYINSPVEILTNPTIIEGLINHHDKYDLFMHFGYMPGI